MGRINNPWKNSALRELATKFYGPTYPGHGAMSHEIEIKKKVQKGRDDSNLLKIYEPVKIPYLECRFYFHER